jgi:gamma-glutamylcyclotransferase (GGCT)/AIG2-like uncharacterized protein YtfP
MHLFVYGTLMDQEIMSRVAGGVFSFKPAVLNDYVRRTVRGEVYPGIVARKGESVQGVLYFDLTAAAIDRLDRFEGELYRRSGVVVDAGHGASIEAQAYIIENEFVHRLSDSEWRFEAFQKYSKNRFQTSYAGYKDLDR